MTDIAANGITIAYEDLGDPAAPAVLLIHGLGTQLIGWPDELCAALVAAGLRVIRFDNRDVGLSSKLDGSGSADLMTALARLMLGQRLDPPYHLDDMASDALGLMDALGLARAHLVGASMGGMIAQILAARRPDRVASLISIMSTSGASGLEPGTAAALRSVVAPRPRLGDRAALVEYLADQLGAIASRSLPPSRAALRDQAARSLARMNHPAGVARQMLAILAAGNRAEALAGIRVPSLVIHGAEDPLIPPAHGRDTAARIPGARLAVIEGMAHDFPVPLIPQIAALIADHCRGALS